MFMNKKMGGTPSRPDPKLTINQFVNEQLSVLNSATQNCSTAVSNNQSIVVKCDANLLAKYPNLCQNVYIHDVDMKQVATLNSKCLQDSVVQGPSTEDMKKASDDAIKQLTSDFKITDKVQQDTVATLVANVATNITNSFTQDCVADIQNKQGILVQNAGNVEIANINMDQTAKAISECTLKTSVVGNAIDKLNNYVQQTVPSDEPTTFSLEKIMEFLHVYGFYMGWAVIFLMSILVGAIKNKYFLPIMFLILSGFIIFQSFAVEKSWPYDSTNLDQNQKILVIASIVGGLCVVIIGGIFFSQKKPNDNLTISSNNISDNSSSN